MQAQLGKILEIQQNQDGSRQGILAWPDGIGKLPAPGQYVQAHNPKDISAPAAISLFPGGLRPFACGENCFQSAPGLPDSWQPGDDVLLRGPLGSGFHIPVETRRVALIAFERLSAPLLPLGGAILATGGEVSLLVDGDFPLLPASVEISPLKGLPEALHWADYVACAVPIEKLPSARGKLSAAGGHVSMQVLVHSPMPCGVLAACGVCAFSSGQGKTLLACEDGPVFDWQKIR